MLLGFPFYLLIIIDIASSSFSSSLGSIFTSKEKDHSKNMMTLSDHESITNTIDPEIMAKLSLDLSFSDGERPKTLELTIPGDIKLDPYNVEIFRSLSLMIPTDLVRTIGNYIIHDESIDEYSNRITNELKRVTKKEIIFNFYDSDFISHLLDITRKNREEVHLSFHFWYDLMRFLFKYALLMRKIFANNDQSFEESVKNIKDIMLIINERTLLYLDVDKIQFMTNFDFSIFESLIEFEIFDHSQLLESFIKEMIDEEGNLKMNLDQIEKIYCNGKFNSNPLLRLMIIQFAFGNLAINQMMEKGWIAKSKSINFHEYRDFAIALSRIYSSKIEEGRESRVDEIESLYTSFLSQSTIKFFIDNRLKFRMDGFSDLVRFLRRIEHIGGIPKRSSMEGITKFKNGGSLKWNENIFDHYLSKAKKEPLCISQGEYNRFVKLIKLIK